MNQQTVDNKVNQLLRQIAKDNEVPIKEVAVDYWNGMQRIKEMHMTLPDWDFLIKKQRQQGQYDVINKLRGLYRIED